VVPVPLSIRIGIPSRHAAWGLEALRTVLDFLHPGDVLTVRTSCGRCGRGARAWKRTEQPIDTSTAAGKCFLLGVFAEFQTNLRRERQLEGIAKAKAVGVYKAARHR
jgi:hypothetical protein